MYPVGDIDCGSDQMFLIAGPCVIEAEPLMMRTAERLKKIASNLGISVIFKSSFSKDNRSSLDFYQGPGPRRGPQAAREGEARVRAAAAHRHPLPVSGGAGGRGRRRHPDPGIPLHAVGARRGRGEDRRGREHQARPIHCARQHGQARQEDRGFGQPQDHPHRARLYVRLQRPHRRSAQLLLAQSDRVSRGIRRRALDPQVRHTEQGPARRARGSSSIRSRARPSRPASTGSSSRRTRIHPRRSATRRASTTSTTSSGSCGR